jgi:hypothetical protein
LRSLFVTISLIGALLGLNTRYAHVPLDPVDYFDWGIVLGRDYGWPWRFLTVWPPAMGRHETGWPPWFESRLYTVPAPEPYLNWMALAGDVAVWVAILAVTLWLAARIWPDR